MWVVDLAIVSFVDLFDVVVSLMNFLIVSCLVDLTTFPLLCWLFWLLVGRFVPLRVFRRICCCVVWLRSWLCLGLVWLFACWGCVV